MSSEPVATEVLKVAESMVIPAISQFEISDYLQLGTTIAGLRVTYIGPNFLKHFGGTVESEIPAAQVAVWRVATWSSDDAILGSVQGILSPETPLAHIIHVLEAGKQGPGLFNGYSNVIYKRSRVDGSLWTPHWYVRGDRLGFGALPSGDPAGWEPGDQVYRTAA